MNEYFALKYLKPHQCYLGQSTEYISTVDTEKFRFKLVISQENFREEIEKNKKELLEGTPYEFLLNHPDQDKMNEWWPTLTKPQRAMYMEFISIKGPNRKKYIDQKINSDVFNEKKGLVYLLTLFVIRNVP